MTEDTRTRFQLQDEEVTSILGPNPYLMRYVMGNGPAPEHLAPVEKLLDEDRVFLGTDFP